MKSPAMRAALALLAIAMSPSAAIRAQIPEVPLNALSGASEYAVIQLRVDPFSSPEMTVYSVFSGGDVLRQQILKRTGSPLHQSLEHMTSLGVSDLVRMIDAGDLRRYEAEEIAKHFPGGVPDLADSGEYILTFRLPLPSAAEPHPATQEWTVTMRHPAFYSRLAPTFAAARSLTDLERRLRSLFR